MTGQISKAQLLQKLEQLKLQEEQARDAYIKDIETFSNLKITTTIQMIKTDEDKHIKILRDMIEMLKV